MQGEKRHLVSNDTIIVAQKEPHFNKMYEMCSRLHFSWGPGECKALIARWTLSIKPICVVEDNSRAVEKIISGTVLLFIHKIFYHISLIEYLSCRYSNSIRTVVKVRMKM